MPYRMPHVEVGMIVNWYPEGNKNDVHAAIVSQVGDEAISLNVVAPDIHNTKAYSGVPHAAKPEINKHVLRENGCWEHSPWMKNVLKGYIKEPRQPEEKVQTPQTTF